MEPLGDVAAQYAEFAGYARGESACFEDWADRVARDPEVLAWLARLPLPKRQPNLVFAAARWHGVPAPGPYAALRAALLGDEGSIRVTITDRSTQTNEVGRLATLLPALSLLAERAEGPLALVEVGASAGLCLYPDRYRYRWTSADGETVLGEGPELGCEVSGPAPLPRAIPPIGWRGGIDLNPLSVRDPEAMAWLETLVWPEHEDRRRLLRTAIGVAAAEPADLVRGDLLEELPRVVAEAARHGRVVVFHSAVLAYLEVDSRREFSRLMRSLVADGECRWISNEPPRVLPDVTSPGLAPGPAEFVLGIDGRAVATTHGHGRRLRWLPGESPGGGPALA